MSIDIKKEVYWYTLRKPKIIQLQADLEVDIAIVGGGMAGLMCAQKLKREHKNLTIAVFESTWCGGGASGKSSGFITPDSELSLSDFVRNFGKEDGKKLWEFVRGGIQSIKDTIQRRNISCDFQDMDSLFIANDEKGFKKVKKEYDTQTELGYKAELYDESTVSTVVNSNDYKGAVRYKDTFGMSAYLYCQDLKESLEREDILIFEETPVTEITAAGLRVNDHTVTADKVVVCTDRFLPDLNFAKNEVYHAQTFVAVSKPISPETIKKIFPTESMMVWDTDLIYQYYRMIGGNRLMLGAASVVYTYAQNPKTFSNLIFKKMNSYLQKKFPEVDIQFEYFWPGLIGVSKDFLPIAGRDPMMKHVYFAGAGAGLPWAAALGEYIADKILLQRDDFDRFFMPRRKFPIGRAAQVIISKPISFAISHGIKKYFR